MAKFFIKFVPLMSSSKLTMEIIKMQKRQTKTKIKEELDDFYLQNQIKKMIKQLGWSQNEFARRFYTQTHDFDDEDEIKKFQQSFNKEMQRATTKKDRLLIYMDFLNKTKSEKNMNLIASKYIKLGCLNDEFIEGMVRISKDLDLVMSEDYNI